MPVNHSAQPSEPVSLSYDGFSSASVSSAEQFSDASEKLWQIGGSDAHALNLPAGGALPCGFNASDAGTAARAAWYALNGRAV
jgi:hypothetical protein